ncbi:1-phosphofructokinase [Ruminococcus albus]|uniref:1-phosphofructokinase n=1 Tax=Ruminococcus albus TaxID=1264 RepID=UPI000463ABC0|nr:1-phosphofructokinase [Ruminococcus albus]MBP5268082.1 1-phosphofructokinase [Ruminococcus sp.]
MVYTVTFNPAIDYVVRMEKLKTGEVNRASYEEMFFGGKGINVSIVLNELGIKSKALGFTAGFTGEAIENGLMAMGIDADFVRLEKGNSRINVKIKTNEETEINGQGPHIDENALAALFGKLDKLKDGDTLILAGSIPNSLPSDIYEKILQRLSCRNIMTVVDATKDLLLNVLKYEPFLIKPNNHELGEMFGVKLTTIDEIEKYARKLQEKGAKNVLISMAGDGALLVDENGETHISGVCKGIVKNSVGAGDSMVAGFVAGSAEGDYEYALKLGTAAGGATAFSDGLATKEKITELLNTL